MWVLGEAEKFAWVLDGFNDGEFLGRNLGDKLAREFIVVGFV